jgi:hypothetical protein
VRQEHEQLPSGKTIVRQFDDDGLLLQEQHSYGLVDIGITMSFRAGAKISEMYLSKRRVCSRQTYERRRAAYPDMPPPDQTLSDHGAALLHAVAAQGRVERRAAAAHASDPSQAAARDAFCTTLMSRGERADAVEWVKSPKHTLGEMSHKASRALVSRLLAQGCARIFACEIQAYPDGGANTAHLVAELPQEGERRAALFGALARLARRHGYARDRDDGQRYAYVKLD